MSVSHAAEVDEIHHIEDDNDGYVTVQVAGQLFGVPVLMVRDVLRPQHIAPIPLAPKEIAGSLNLRGRIVTAIDVCARLGLPAPEDPLKCMSVVVEHGDWLYSLLVDSVGDVLTPSDEYYERSPSNLDERWKHVSSGVYQLESEILVVLDVERLLQF